MFFNVFFCQLTFILDLNNIWGAKERQEREITQHESGMLLFFFSYTLYYK